MKNKDNIKKAVIIVLILIILILLYLLILRAGYIVHHGPVVPTGNVDIFEINCKCTCKDKKHCECGFNKNKSNIEDLIVYDKDKIWDNKELRIFSNPAYEYESIIAPGSLNTYTYVVRNNNDFDMVIDMKFVEENEKDINMKFKVKSQGKYLIGSEDKYDEIKDKTIEQIKIPAKSQISYILDWKWIDSDNDTQIGFDIGSTYKLSINIGANELL